MAKKFRTMDEPEGEFWRPENPGDFIEGIILEIDEGDYGLQAKLDTENGEKTTPSHRNLQGYLEDLEPGDYVRITLKEFIDTGKPNPFAKYQVDIAEDD
jgi:hypothetical protein